mgnify:CR=1 FL=1
MFNLLKVLQRAILYLIIIILPAPALFSQSISGARFDYNFPYAADSQEREALQRAYDRLSIKNPDLTGLNDETIKKSGEEGVAKVFKQLENAKKQFETVTDEREKIFARQVLNNYTQLFRAYRILVPTGNNRSDVKPGTGATNNDSTGSYDNSRTPFSFRLVRAELTPDGPLIEVEVNVETIEFYASINNSKLGQFAEQRWTIGSIIMQFMANGEEIRPFGNPEKPANGRDQLKQDYKNLGDFKFTAGNLTNSFMLDHGREYAARVNFTWPLDPKTEMTAKIIKESWIWRPKAQKNFSNEYQITIFNALNQIIHQEKITIKTGSDFAGAQIEHKSLIDSSSLIWGLGTAILGLGLLGMFKLGRTGTPDAGTTPPLVNGNDHSQTENDDEQQADQARIIFDNSGRSLVLVTGSGQPADFSARVVDSQISGWQLQAQLLSGEQCLTIEQKSATAVDSASYILKETSPALQQGEQTREFALHVVARHETKTISKTLDIVIGREGLFVLSPRPLIIVADAESATELKVTAIEFYDGLLATDHDALINLKLTFDADDDLSRKAFETSEVDFRAESEWENVRAAIDAYERSNTFAALVLHAKTARALPSKKNDAGTDNVFSGRLKLTTSSRKQNYELVLPVELHAPAEPARSERLATELENCRLIIERYVPDEGGHKEKFRDMLDRFGPTLGPEGLYKLRHDIWKISQKLWEAKGLQGYVEMAERIETYDKLRNWAEWSGDIALSILLYCKSGGGIGGTLKQTAVTLLKQILVSAINHYKDTVELKGRFTNEDYETWVDVQLRNQLFSTPDYMLTAASLSGMISSGRAMVLMFASIFLKSLVSNVDWKKLGANWDEKGLDIEACNDIGKAAWAASQECFKAVGTMAITQWLTGVTVRSAIKNKVPLHDDVMREYAKFRLIEEEIPLKKTANTDTPDTSPEVLNQRAKEILDSNDIPIKTGSVYDQNNTTPVVNEMVANIRNGRARSEDVVRCLADNKTQAMRTIKNLPENVQNAFMKTLREDFYNPHDTSLIKHLEAQTNVPWAAKTIDGKTVKPEIRIFETSTPGKKTAFSQDRDFCPKYFDQKSQQWLEITPVKKWKEASDKWWKNKTGFDAENLQQAAMTRLGDEACPDYATQQWNASTNRFDVIEPNIVKVYAGEGRLKSPVELAAMYKNKIDGPLKHGNQAESIAQLKKGIQVYDKVLKSYKKQGFRVNQPTDEFRLGMEILSWAPDDYQANPEVIVRLNKILAESTGISSFQEFGRELVIKMGQF